MDGKGTDAALTHEKIDGVEEGGKA
jgi:hypothetical protein